MDRFDGPGAPSELCMREMKLPAMISAWMSPKGNELFQKMVREYGYIDYEIDSIGISSISAACSDALYETFSEREIDDTIALAAKSIADARMVYIEVRRERNEYRSCLNMPPRPLPVEREIERQPGMSYNFSSEEPFFTGECDSTDEYDAYDPYDPYDAYDAYDPTDPVDRNDPHDIRHI